MLIRIDGKWLTLSTELQHWMGPVEHELAVEVGAGAVTVTVVVFAGGGTPPRFISMGVATARTAREANATTVGRRANMAAKDVRRGMRAKRVGAVRAVWACC